MVLTGHKSIALNTVVVIIDLPPVISTESNRQADDIQAKIFITIPACINQLEVNNCPEYFVSTSLLISHPLVLNQYRV